VRAPSPPAAARASMGAMELLEIEQRETLRREEVARRLHALADQLARHNDVEFDRGGAHFRLKVPDEVNVKVELEVEDGGAELEIELSW
jgi:amphi-Trp domain-containing protein